MGGEEFVVILPECSLDQAYDIAQRMRKEIAASDNGVCKLTVSIGVAECSGGDCIETINKADKVLYEAKREGRNKVKRYGTS
jgi:diguanylate cyclase (GGDEF)-like protein